jgi:hypothetical protein
MMSVLVRFTTQPLVGALNPELISGNHYQLGPHCVMTWTAEFVARHRIFAGMRKLEIGHAHYSGYNLDAVVCAAETEFVNHVRTRDPKVDRHPGRYQQALRHKQILFRNDANGDRAVGFQGRTQIVFNKFSLQMKRSRVDPVSSEEMADGGFEFIWEADRDP